MPYTPPSHRSPASSASASPDVSRRSSLQPGASRPSLPRSASYLNKHRRTPSVTGVSDTSVASITPQGTSEDLPSLALDVGQRGVSNVRQSPPPRTDERGIPVGAVISPPDSATSGSDDEMTPEIRGRKTDKLKDLRDAVSQIPHARIPSPSSHPSVGNDESLSAEKDSHRTMRISFSTSALDDLPSSSRKIGHVRSATEPNAALGQSAENSTTASEEDTDEDLKTKPQMVRKKSGELVRPALRPTSRRRPSSMPGTPVFSKAVHFDSHLEHVRHFLQVDRPLAVSAGSSPVENYESDTEYPFPGESRPASPRTPPFEWEIITPNFPHDSHVRKTLPVKLERVWLSPDQKSMLGSVAVANIAFQKSLTCRFTLDYWKTTSEVAAEYCHEIRPRDTPMGYDRFNFVIKLSDTANLESKTLFFCVRYSVNGQEFWDNNGSANFQVDFRKKHLPQNGKNSFQGASGRSKNALPRSNRRQNPSSSLRPKSMPVDLKDFGNDSSFKFDQPLHEYLGESDSGTTGLRLKTKSSSNIASDNIAKGLLSPSGVAFANRYDFSASLSAAVQAAKDSMVKDKEVLYMKDNFRGSRYLQESQANSSPPLFSPVGEPSGTDSAVPSLPSASYEELVNKYCFFGTKAIGPQKDGQMKGGRYDGTSGDDKPGADTQTRTNSTQATGSGQDLMPSLLAVDSSTPSISDPPSPNYIPVGSQDSQAISDVDCSGDHQSLPAHFAWRGDTHTTPAIRG